MGQLNNMQQTLAAIITTPKGKLLLPLVLLGKVLRLIMNVKV